MSAVPLFDPDALGEVVVWADPAVLLCAPGALYALTVEEGRPPAYAKTFRSLGTPSAKGMLPLPPPLPLSLLLPLNPKVVSTAS